MIVILILDKKKPEYWEWSLVASGRNEVLRFILMIYICGICVGVCVHVSAYSHGVQKRAADLLELELQVVVVWPASMPGC